MYYGADDKNVLLFLLKVCTKKKKHLYLHSQNGTIAQLVEQRTENPCVPGSIPGGTTFKRFKIKQIPEFQTNSGIFVFTGNAKNSTLQHPSQD